MAAFLVERAPGATVVFAVVVAAFAAGELTQALRRHPPSSAIDRVGEVLFRGLFFGAILLLPLGASVVPDAVLPGGAVTFFAGAVLACLGLLLRWWCFLTLGRSFSVVLRTSPGQGLVQRGPYRFVRHPSYTGVLLVLAGCAVMLGNWVGLLASFALLLAAVVHRIHVEERALVETLGDSYRSFAAARARLVPFVW